MQCTVNFTGALAKWDEALSITPQDPVLYEMKVGYRAVVMDSLPPCDSHHMKPLTEYVCPSLPFLAGTSIHGA